MMRDLNYGALTGLALILLCWAGFFVAVGFLSRSALWLFCVGYGCN